jgi:hypothetical protein
MSKSVKWKLAVICLANLPLVTYLVAGVEQGKSSHCHAGSPCCVRVMKGVVGHRHLWTLDSILLHPAVDGPHDT